MKARSLPAVAGWHWLRGGYLIYRRNPALMALAVFAYLALLLVINLVPLLGPVLATLLSPVFSVGIMTLCRDLDQGRLPQPARFFSGFEHGRDTLLMLGGLYFLITRGALFLSSLLDGGTMMEFLMTGSLSAVEASDQAMVLLTPFLILALLTPVFMAYWYAPMLASWHQTSLAKALFFSFFACWQNWRPFLVYALALMTLMVALPGTLLLMVAAILPQAVSPVASLLSFPLMLIALPILFTSFYVTYRDVFGTSEFV
ncbi:MAG: hypothetical protein BWY57_01238 [Betaproteobacteria bacterium ADurb.Bin341]|nr:MAG: hypothetical protein BWY57_01238 [Betaproteobacteria bacterium ADurb.Bin341]